MFAEGLWPNMKAGSATEAHIDLRCRGGILIIRRLILPSAQSYSLEHISSIC